MAWKNAVERWRPVVVSELNRAGIPLPPNLILSVIHVESRGHPGSTNSKSGASGLMQVMPKTLGWYNKQTGDNISLAQLRSKEYPVQQIRVGIWVLARFWHGAHSYLQEKLTEIPIDELAKISDLFYVAGPGATKQRLDKLKIPFFKYVEQRFPKWNALLHPRNVFGNLPSNTLWDVPALSKWLGTALRRARRIRDGSLLAIAAVALGYWIFLKKKNR